MLQVLDIRHAWHADPTEPGGLPYSPSLELDREEEEEEEAAAGFSNNDNDLRD